MPDRHLPLSPSTYDVEAVRDGIPIVVAEQVHIVPLIVDRLSSGDMLEALRRVL